MRDAACTRDDINAAFEDLNERLEARRSGLWAAYAEATDAMTRRDYDDCEPECWIVLGAGLSGIDAEQRMLRRDLEQRLAMFDEHEAVA